MILVNDPKSFFELHEPNIFHLINKKKKHPTLGSECVNKKIKEQAYLNKEKGRIKLCTRADIF